MATTAFGTGPVAGKEIAPRDRLREDIYNRIVASPDITPADLARSSGLAPSTVHHAVQRLLGEGRISVSKVGSKGPGSGSGRPGRCYKAASGRKVFGAIDFGRTHVRIALSDESCEPIEEVELAVAAGTDAHRTIEIAAESIKAMNRGRQPLTGVVAGIPAPVDRRTRTTPPTSPNGNWRSFDVGRELERHIGAQVHVENDVSLATYGELMSGAGRGQRDFLYIKASNGVGAGLVLDGRLYTGAFGMVGEIAHTVLNENSDLCRCGRRGCLSTQVSSDLAREQLRPTHPDIDSSRELPREEDDPTVGVLLEEMGRTLGRLIAHHCNLLNPSAVLVGGELGMSGPSYIRGIEASIARYAQAVIAEDLVVLPAELGLRSELVGAMHSARALMGTQS